MKALVTRSQSAVGPVMPTDQSVAVAPGLARFLSSLAHRKLTTRPLEIPTLAAGSPIIPRCTPPSITPRRLVRKDFEPLPLGRKKTRSSWGLALTARCFQLASKKLVETVGPMPKKVSQERVVPPVRALPPPTASASPSPQA